MELDCTAPLGQQAARQERSFIYIGMALVLQAAVYLARASISTAKPLGTAQVELERPQAQPLTREALALAVARAVARGGSQVALEGGALNCSSSATAVQFIC